MDKTKYRYSVTQLQIMEVSTQAWPYAIFNMENKESYLLTTWIYYSLSFCHECDFVRTIIKLVFKYYFLNLTLSTVFEDLSFSMTGPQYL